MGFITSVQDGYEYFYRIRATDENRRNRSQYREIMVRTQPTQPVDLFADRVRNGIRLRWNTIEVGTRYYAITVYSSAGIAIQTINLPLAATTYTFTGLTFGATYSFAVAHRDDLTGLYSDRSEKSNPVSLFTTLANESVVVDYRIGNIQPQRVYAGDKLIWVH